MMYTLHTLNTHMVVVVVMMMMMSDLKGLSEHWNGPENLDLRTSCVINK